jgi:hypothetical protein
MSQAAFVKNEDKYTEGDKKGKKILNSEIYRHFLGYYIKEEEIKGLEEKIAESRQEKYKKKLEAHLVDLKKVEMAKIKASGYWGEGNPPGILWENQDIPEIRHNHILYMLKIIDVMYKEAIVELFNQGHDVDEIVGHLNLLNELKTAIPSANYAERQKPYITELMKLIIERALSNGNIAINEEVLGHTGSFIDESIQLGIKWWRTPGATRFRGAMAFIPNIAIIRNKIRDFFNKEHVAIHNKFKSFSVMERYSMYDYLNMILSKNFPFFEKIKQIIHDVYKLVASIYEGNPEFINMEANRVE